MKFTFRDLIMATIILVIFISYWAFGFWMFSKQFVLDYTNNGGVAFIIFHIALFPILVVWCIYLGKMVYTTFDRSNMNQEKGVKG